MPVAMFFLTRFLPLGEAMFVYPDGRKSKLEKKKTNGSA
jgi:hypothetical protein